MASSPSSSYSSYSESSSVLPPEVLPPLSFLSRLSPLSSSLGSGSSPPLPINPGLEVMAPFLEAGRDFVLGLSLVDEVLLEELPEFDPSFLLESAFSMILPWLWLMLLLMSISFSVFSRQKVPKPTTAIRATMMVMLRGVNSFLGFSTCLSETSSASERVGSTYKECCSWWEDGSGNTLSIIEIYMSGWWWQEIYCKAEITSIRNDSTGRKSQIFKFRCSDGLDGMDRGGSTRSLSSKAFLANIKALEEYRRQIQGSLLISLIKKGQGIMGWSVLSGGRFQYQILLMVKPFQSILDVWGANELRAILFGKSILHAIRLINYVFMPGSIGKPYSQNRNGA